MSYQPPTPGTHPAAPAPTPQQIEAAKNRNAGLMRIQDTLKSDIVRDQFVQAVGSPEAGFYITSAIIAVKSSEKLQLCDPDSIVNSALRAANLRLSVDPSVGHAYLVPYKNRCTFITGYKGLLFMAIRTGRYETVHCGPIYQGQEIEENQITGMITIVGDYDRARDDRGKILAPVIGWLASFKLTNRWGGYAKNLYMTVAQIHAHAKQYSPSYNFPDSAWKTDTWKMERKTVLRLCLLYWGYLDPSDRATLQKEDDTVDGEPIEVINAPDLDEDGNPIPERSAAQGLAEMGFPQPPPGDPDPDQHVNDPAPDLNGPSWSDEELNILIKSGLAKNAFSARGMLGLSNLRPGDPPDIIRSWATLYREKRGLRPTKDSPSAKVAAEFANQQMPRPQ